MCSSPGSPGRHEPDEGEIDYGYLFRTLDRLGYTGWVGAEYSPRAGTLEGLGWLKKWAGVGWVKRSATQHFPACRGCWVAGKVPLTQPTALLLGFARRALDPDCMSLP